MLSGGRGYERLGAAAAATEYFLDYLSGRSKFPALS